MFDEKSFSFEDFQENSRKIARWVFFTPFLGPPFEKVSIRISFVNLKGVVFIYQDFIHEIMRFPKPQLKSLRCRCGCGFCCGRKKTATSKVLILFSFKLFIFQTPWNFLFIKVTVDKFDQYKMKKIFRTKRKCTYC